MIQLNSIKLNDGTHGLPKNPRLIKDERFKHLCDSIRANPEYMPARPIVVDENNVILGGNMRWRACRELGMKEIPAAWVKRVEGWTLEKKRRFIILDNRLWGEDDWDELANEWEEDELLAAGFEDLLFLGLGVNEHAAPVLASGEKMPLRVATFIIHEQQYLTVEAALKKAKADGHGESELNENSNGNALAHICERFCRAPRKRHHH